MAILKINDIRNLDNKAIRDKLYQLKAELVKENTNSRLSGKNINTGRIKEIRKAIARLLTVMRERGVA